MFSFGPVPGDVLGERCRRVTTWLWRQWLRCQRTNSEENMAHFGVWVLQGDAPAVSPWLEYGRSISLQAKPWQHKLMSGRSHANNLKASKRPKASPVAGRHSQPQYAGKAGESMAGESTRLSATASRALASILSAVLNLEVLLVGFAA